VEDSSSALPHAGSRKAEKQINRAEVRVLMEVIIAFWIG
jgi:hypothetical protein